MANQRRWSLLACSVVLCGAVHGSVIVCDQCGAQVLLHAVNHLHHHLRFVAEKRAAMTTP